MCAHAHMETGFLFFFSFPICGFFFLFAENANKRKTRFSIEGTSLLQYEDINWIGRIPHAVVSKVLWQLTERHLETQELGLVWRNFPTWVVSKGKWMWEKGEDSSGGVQKEKRKECHWRGRKWNAALFLPSTSFPSFLWTDDSSPLRGELSSLLKPWCILLCPHFRWTSPLHIFIIYFVSHGIINMLLSLRNEGWLWGAGPVFSSHMWHISQWRSHSLQNIPQCSTSGSPLSLVLFLPLLPPENESSHAIAVGDWLIWTLIEWMLFRIFFWWPAKVTPILRRSLGGETQKKAL